MLLKYLFFQQLLSGYLCPSLRTPPTHIKVKVVVPSASTSLSTTCEPLLSLKAQERVMSAQPALCMSSAILLRVN